MSALQPLFERNQEATVYVGNIDLKVTEEILWELFVQCGPVVNVHVPRDKITSDHQGYGFIEFRSEEDADYAIKIMHMIKLYGKPIKVNKASQDKRTMEVGANLFVGNLDPEVDEKTIFDTFSTFGTILSTKIMRNPETGASKGFGFISYDNFDSSDAALNSMNGQFLSNRAIHVSYAYKEDTKGERHGSAAERLLAANRPTTSTRPGLGGFGGSESQAPQSLQMPTSMFPGQMQQQGGMNMPPIPMGMPPMMAPHQGMPLIPNMGGNMMMPPLGGMPGMGMMGQPPIPQQIPMNLPPLPNMQGMPNIPRQGLPTPPNQMPPNMPRF